VSLPVAFILGWPQLRLGGRAADIWFGILPTCSPPIPTFTQPFGECKEKEISEVSLYYVETALSSSRDKLHPRCHAIIIVSKHPNLSKFENCGELAPISVNFRKKSPCAGHTERCKQEFFKAEIYIFTRGKVTNFKKIGEPVFTSEP
jgi:hypothetical protein